jgi:hypothetical protein
MEKSLSPAKTKLYHQDGTGRDTYIGFNSGGNTIGNFPAGSIHNGSFTPA